MPKRAAPMGAASKAKRRKTAKPSMVILAPGRGVVVPASTIPRKQTRKLVYSDVFARDAGSGVAASYFYSCNSLFDPDRTGVGHQPMGFDQLMEFYDHYTVIGAKLTLKALSQSTTLPGANQVITVKLRDSTTGPPAAVTTAIEQGECTYGLLGSADGASAQLTLQKGVNPVKFLGRAGPLTDSQLKGSSGSNPLEECFFQISLQALGAGDDPPAVDFLVTIEYTAIFTEPKPLIGS